MRTFHAGCRRLEIEQEVQHIYCDPCWSSEAACMHITISMSNSIETAGHRKTLLENESLLAHNAQANPPCPAELLRFAISSATIAWERRFGVG